MKKKVLIFIDWYLPGYKAGGPVQSVANLTAHLQNEFDFLIITRDTDYTETQPMKNIRSNHWNNINDYTKVYYISQDNLRFSFIKNLIKETDFDVAYINGIYSKLFSIYPLHILKNSPKKIVVASRGMLASSAIGVKRLKKRLFLSLASIFGLYRKVLFHATNQAEVNDIKRETQSKNILIAPNLPKLIDIDNIQAKKIKEMGTLRLFCIARISPEKNLKYALEILKQCKSEIHFDFYGPVYNKEYWQECQLIIESMPSNLKVSYKGSIENTEIINTIKNYHFLFMPTQGENFGHIILESLMSSCPVIISDRTPWINLKQNNIGFDISLSRPELFIETIDNLVHLNNEDFQEMASASKEFARSYLKNEEHIASNKRLFN